VSPLQRAYPTELDRNDVPTTACRTHAGAARWADNWGLTRKPAAYAATGKSPSAMDLHRERNALKASAVPWMDALAQCAPQEAVRNLETACAHSFRRAHRQHQGTLGGKVGYAQCTSKKRGLGGCRLSGGIVVFPDALQLPRRGRLRLNEHGDLPPLPPDATSLSATVTEQAGHWYGSALGEQAQGEQAQGVPENSGPVVGVDLGVKVLAPLADGTVEAHPRHVQSCRRTSKRFQRAVSRQRKGSHNRHQAAQRLGGLHRTVATQRTNTVQQLTSRLAKTKAVVVIEDLNVSGMLRNHHLAQAIGDVGFGEVRRQLTYKAAWYGGRVVVASRWEPSSKTCSACGWEDDGLPLADRVFRCESGGQVRDRDLTAAIHLAQLADSSSDRQNACGEASAGYGREAVVKLAPMKQEPNTFDASA
jgi:putative transposase